VTVFADSLIEPYGSVKLTWFGFSASVGWDSYVKDEPKNPQWPDTKKMTPKIKETGVWKLKAKHFTQKVSENGVGHASLLPRWDNPCVFFLF